MQRSKSARKTSDLNVILARADTTITDPGTLTLENSNSGILLRNCRIVLPKNGALDLAGTGIVKSNGELAESVRISWTERTNPFTDVKETDPYYNAVLWAYESGIEKGSGGKFRPNTDCTRASTVLYLYRFYTGRDLL